MYLLREKSTLFLIVKICLLTIALLPSIAWAQAETIVPESTPNQVVEKESSEDQIGGWEPLAPDEEEILEEIQIENQEQDINWVDDSHAYMTDRAQALTEWMDEFFGDPTHDLEKAESLLRLEFSDDWEQDEGHDFSVRLRGKLQLPRISKRLDLVFAGEESDVTDELEREQENAVALQYQLGRERKRSRVDLTMGVASGNLRPGVKYRNQGPINDRNRYRFQERLQYEDGEGFFSITQLDLYRKRSEDSEWRWSNRGVWGERTEGVEWRTRLAMRKRYDIETKRPYAINYFGAIRGVTRPDSYVKNYRLGLTWRRQVYRDFLFMEVEPSYNLRRPNLDESREGFWGVEVRFEIALERDLRRLRDRDSDEMAEPQTPSVADPTAGVEPATQDNY